jgi:hypothetical protein
MIELGKYRFHVPAPSGMRTFALQQRIVPVAGRVAGVFLALLDKGADLVSLADMDVVKVLPSALPHIGHIFSEMPPGELEWITRELLRDAKFSEGDKTPMPLFGSPGGDAFDAVMQGKTTDVWRLLWHAVEVWYPDFFAHARALTARTEKAASHSAASSTSPGSGLVSASL